MWIEKPPKTFKPKIHRISTFARKLTDILNTYEGSTFKEALDLEFLAADILELFPMFHKDLLLPSLQPIVGVELTSELIAKFALRLAANENTILTGNILLPFTSFAAPTWDAVKFIVSLPEKTKANKKYSPFTFKILTGIAAGEIFQQLLSEAQLGGIARFIGFTKRGLKQYDGGKASFFGFNMPALLTTTDDGKIKFTSCAPAKYAAVNRKLVTMRQTIPCHKGLTCRCNKCRQGIDQCHRACRLTTLVNRPCVKCLNQMALFDGNFCISCYMQKSI